MAHLRSLLVVGTTIGFLPACGLLIGLNDYEVVDSSDSSLAGGTNSGGNKNSSGGSNGSGGKGMGGDEGNSGGDEGNSGGNGSGGVLVEPDCTDAIDCDDENDCTTDSCNDGECSYATEDAGNSCGGGVCNGVIGGSKCVRCIDDQAGESQDSGCPAGAPRCDADGTAICVGCERHSDCDDGNDCTTDTCTSGGECSLTPVAKGEACGGSMICNGVEGSEECVPCVDDQSDGSTDTGCDSSSPYCDMNGTNNCQVCLDDASGMNQDSGCAGDSPLCDGGTCVACIDDIDCSDGISCTDDSCLAGQCVNSENDGNCAGGTVCQPMVCDPTLDCQQTDVSTIQPFITDSMGNGSFEITSPLTWAEAGGTTSFWTCVDSYPCAGSVDDTTSSHGDILGWFGGLDNFTSSINQSLSLPVGTVELTLTADINFQTLESGNTVKDTFVVSLTDIGGTVLDTFANYSNVDAQTATADWSLDGLSTTMDVTSWAGSTVKIEFRGVADGSEVTDFFVDRIRLSAMVCQ